MLAPSPLRVVLIEDDPDTSANLKDVLELDGHDVIAMKGIVEAMEWQLWNTADAAIIDRKLGYESADEYLPFLRSRAPRTSFIILTGYGDFDSAVRAIKSGAVDYLVKPVNPDLLRTAVLRVGRTKAVEENLRRSERLAAIGEAVAELSHESRNALNRIRACATLLDRGLDPDSPLRSFSGEISRSTMEVVSLFDDVRRYAAPLALNLERCDLADVWREAWAAVGCSETTRGFRELEEHLVTPDTGCTVDAARMHQVFRNIFDNAVDACGERAQIRVRCSPTLLSERPALSVSIVDNGPGLGEEQRRRLFDPFYTTKSTGTGLGLAITKRIVDAHGGEIRVPPRSEGGAEFELLIPR